MTYRAIDVSKQKKANIHEYVQIHDARNMKNDFSAENEQTIIQCLRRTFYWTIRSEAGTYELEKSEKCIHDSEQTAKYLWESCAKSELKHLRNIETDLIRIVQEKDKHIEFQLLLKKIEKRLKDKKVQKQ